MLQRLIKLPNTPTNIQYSLTKSSKRLNPNKSNLTSKSSPKPSFKHIHSQSNIKQILRTPKNKTIIIHHSYIIIISRFTCEFQVKQRKKSNWCCIPIGCQSHLFSWDQYSICFAYWWALHNWTWTSCRSATEEHYPRLYGYSIEYRKCAIH